MKRRLVAGAAALALFAAVAAPASADRGSPGHTFPEQPNGHVLNACDAVFSNAGTGVTHMSDRAFAITGGVFDDACGLD